MANLSVFNMEGKEVGTIEVSDAVFGVEVNEHLVHMAVVQQLANKRQGTQKAKTRSEVSGGGRKPWRQNGTGHARQGSTRAPQWTGGGVVFAPKSRDFSKKMNVTAKRIALFSALSQKIRDDEVVFVEELKVAAPKTNEVVKMLDAFKLEKSVLIVTNGKDEDLVRAANNLEKVTTVPVELINTYDVVKSAKVVMSKDAALKLEEVYGA